MASDRVFIDTWAWLVLSNDRDPAFSAVSQMRAATAKRIGVWVTTDYVLGETITRLFPARHFAAASRYIEGILDASRLGFIDLEYITRERFMQAYQLRLRYHDKPRISFTDLTSFVVMRELRITQVLTGDAHFDHAGMSFVRLPRPVH